MQEQLAFQHLTHMGSKQRFVTETMFLGCLVIFHQIWGYMKTTYLFVMFTMKKECYAGTKIFSVADFLHKIKAYPMVREWLHNIAVIELARAKTSVKLLCYWDR
jgi:hypothetical protein